MLTFPEPPKHICVLRLSAIGDCVHTLAVVRSLQAAWPQSQITWVIGRVEASLMRGIEGVELIEFDKKQGWTAYKALNTAMSGREFDLLLHMQISLRSSIASLMIKAKHRLGFDRSRAKNAQWLFCNQQIAPKQRQHVQDSLFGFTQSLGISTHKPQWNIPLSEADRTFAAQHLGQRNLIISPCSSQRRFNYRNWPLEHYLKVASHAQQVYGCKIILSGGNTEQELDYAARIAAALDPALTANLVAKTSLKQLLAMIDAADAVLCPDSGPAHMARSVETPVLGLYATTNPLRSGPYQRLEWTVDAYSEAVMQEFSTTPEQLKWGQRVRDPEAMSLISTDMVIDKLRLLFDKEKR